MRSNPVHHFLFIFQLENILQSNLNFSTSYGCSTDLESSLGYLLIGGEEDVCPPCPDGVDIACVQAG